MLNITKPAIVNDWYDCTMIYGYIYKTILPDTRSYVGQKKGFPIVQNYFGSGQHLNNWFIKNTGFKSMKCPFELAQDKGVIRIILAYAIDQDELNFLEKYFIKQEQENVDDGFCLNIREGGNAAEYKQLSELGRQHSTEALLSPENRAKALESRRKKAALGLASPTAETLQKRSNSIKLALQKKPIWNKGLTKESDPRVARLYENNQEQRRANLRKATANSVKTIKGSRWWNNGDIQIRSKECPEGFKPGMLKRADAGGTHNEK